MISFVISLRRFQASFITLFVFQFGEAQKEEKGEEKGVISASCTQSYTVRK